MDVLWYTLDDFIPLLYCFPDGLVIDSETECWIGARWNLFTFTKETLSESDVTRFAHHARRVRVLNSLTPQKAFDKRPSMDVQLSRMLGGRPRDWNPWRPDHVGSYVDDSCFQILHKFFGHSPALPALRVLCCNHPNLYDMSHLTLFFSPTLRRLVFSENCAHFRFEYVFANLEKSPCRNTLTALQLDDNPTAASANIKLDAYDVVFLASLPRLEWLQLFLDTSIDCNTMCQELPVAPFPSLRCLKLTYHNIKQEDSDPSDGDLALKDFTTLLRHLQPLCPLQHLPITVAGNGDISHASIRAFFAALAAFRPSLVSLGMVIMAPSRAGEPPFGIHDLAPLLELPVKELSLEAIYMDISRADLHVFTAAWPRLNWLHLGQDNADTATLFPLSTLPDIVRTMPYLTQLGLRVHDDGEPLDIDAPVDPALQRISMVDLGSSSLQNRERAALFIARSFPNATSLLYDPHDSRVKAFWWQATDHVRRHIREGMQSDAILASLAGLVVPPPRSRRYVEIVLDDEVEDEVDGIATGVGQVAV
ncbi:uncharacterized protein PHACADRAFT_248788 [Phanerochaete carnosa HHB-10118-sp]|uniref:Uncharacterized protein n=1 Tax=Phanerochaete carnosa (strain HHB-10118-sp) TaxID=650164 RepID=K5WR00_PHACS|nr:uncharacterized protein PHACADRAFT_248788 [Phanerochaete carnosa HHB-10118-sp]EKM61885.1 hypothetical protein PHACADRAFT_248788 [Phanerochaete carnosa HHB-10118-sp]